MGKVINLVNIRDEAVSQIKAAFSKDKRITVEAHSGRFSEAEIRRLAVKTPAVLTALVRYKDGDEDNAAADFVCWVLHRATNADKLYDGALTIVSFLMPVIRSIDTDWAYNVEDVEAENLFTGALDSMNVTLWAVSWKWKLRGSILTGGGAGIVLPEGLEDFKAIESSLVVGDQTVGDITNLED